MADFITPAFLQNRSVDEIHALMKSILPADIDISEGGHEWNMTRPTALVVAEICEFILPEVIKLIFPEWSYGEFLDGHAKTRNITRRAATAATGEVTVTGAAKTTIPAGSMFSTASINDEPSVDYISTEAATIPESGTIDIKIQCTQSGVIGNTAANTIILVSSKLTGVTSVTNAEALTGGTEEESDESLQRRISEYDKSQGDNYIGNPSDYKRWAESVAGVGEATIISAQDTSGTVTIVLTDANGAPATELLCEQVYNYIMSPEAPNERLAPINAVLSVVAPATMEIGISATIELEESYNIEAVKTNFLANLAIYLPTAMEDGEIKYTSVHAVLHGTEGVNDFKDLKIGIKTSGSVNYGTSNIPIEITKLPTIDENDLVLQTGIV